MQIGTILLWHHVSLFLVLASKLRVQTSSLCPPGFKSIGTCSAGLSQHTSLHCLPHFTLRVPLSITVLLQWLQRLFQPSLRCPALGFWLACLEPCSQTIHIHLRPYSTHDHTITYTPETRNTTITIAEVNWQIKIGQLQPHNIQLHKVKCSVTRIIPDTPGTPPHSSPRSPLRAVHQA